MPLQNQNKKISQLTTLTNPTGNAVFPLALSGTTYKLSLSAVTQFANVDILNTLLSGFAIGINQPLSSGDTILSGFENLQAQIDSVDAKHWQSNATKTISSESTKIVSGNYVLSAVSLTLNSDNLNIDISGIDFDKYGQMFIGGYLLLIDTNIINDGLVSVGGGLIMSGDCAITGNGIIT